MVDYHRQLPPHSPFASYADLRTYWKLAYGYTLPVRESELYLDVRFNGMRDSLL